MTTPTPRVLSVAAAPTHTFSKPSVPSITLITDHGIQGDCHAGKTVQHRSRLHIRPPPDNLRQVHLIPVEILHQVSASLLAAEKTQLLKPGALGQNITTEGIDLLGLSTGTELRFITSTSSPAAETESNDSDGPILVVTGLRNPCPQIDKFLPGLKERFLVRDANRQIVGRLAGVMTTIRRGGQIRPGMEIVIVRPGEYVPLGPV